MKIFHESADTAITQLELIDLQQNYELKKQLLANGVEVFIDTYLQRSCICEPPLCISLHLMVQPMCVKVVSTENELVRTLPFE